MASKTVIVATPYLIAVGLVVAWIILGPYGPLYLLVGLLMLILAFALWAVVMALLEHR